jgi:hypothetical protein
MYLRGRQRLPGLSYYLRFVVVTIEGDIIKKKFYNGHNENKF